MVGNCALDTLHRGKAAVMGNVRRLGTPRRDGTQPRRDQQQAALPEQGRATPEYPANPSAGRPGRRPAGIIQFDEIPVLGHQPDTGKRVAEGLLEACQARCRERRGAPQGKEFSHDRSRQRRLSGKRHCRLAPRSGAGRLLGGMVRALSHPEAHVLEKLAAEYGGRFRLAKVNSDTKSGTCCAVCGAWDSQRQGVHRRCSGTGIHRCPARSESAGLHR
jgi:hypothetical protein